MHGGVRVWQLIIKVLVLESNSMHVVVLHIIEDCQVIVDVASSVQVLREEIEPHIVPMGRLNLISRCLYMPKILSEWQLGDLGVKHGHLPLEKFILTGVVVGILVCHSES